MTLDPQQLLEAVDEVARLAGGVALKYFRRPIEIELKADGSPVTVADRAAEAAARDWINRHFPGDAVLGEELGEQPSEGRRRWFIDPIDGTKSFVRGVPLWGAMVGVAIDDCMIAGAINCAATGDLVVAAVGCGCWHNGLRTRVSTVDALPAATILTTDDSFASHPERVDVWTRLAQGVAVSRTWGDCYGYVMVATGRAEVMADDHLNPWDSAPLIPIINEAGGTFTDWRGTCSLRAADGLATNAMLSQSVRRALGIAP